jgi:hypothetical protein
MVSNSPNLVTLLAHPWSSMAMEAFVFGAAPTEILGAPKISMAAPRFSEKK